MELKVVYPRWVAERARVLGIHYMELKAPNPLKPLPTNLGIHYMELKGGAGRMPCLLGGWAGESITWS
jgi:hypothetical protein